MVRARRTMNVAVLVVAMRSCGLGKRIRARKWRRHDAGKLRHDEQRNQDADERSEGSEPLHWR